MAQQATITVFDGAATPVSHSLQGEEVGKTGTAGAETILAVWREQISTVPSYAQVTFSLIKRKLKSGVTHAVARVEVPVMEAILNQNSSGYTAPPKVAYVDRFELVSYTAERSTELTKRIAMQMLLNWSSNVSVTTPAISAGVVADLHQRRLQVT